MTMLAPAISAVCEDISSAVISALKERSVFHSEADFQHHLAWYTRLYLEGNEEDVDVRIEYPMPKTDLELKGKNSREHCDILLRYPNKVGIELKYRTSKLECEINGEGFELKDHGAPDAGQHGFLTDISRLERWRDQGAIDIGFALLLTNDSKLWNPPARANNYGKQFEIDEGKKSSGDLFWHPDTSPKTLKDYPHPIKLRGEYTMNWEDVPVKHAPKGEFRYLLVPVKPDGE